ncbi:hypothetical protein MNBD_ALPHA05-2346, partial [hydrothermal vent metagenome]
MKRRTGFKFFALALPALALLACTPAEERADEPQAQAADYTPHGLLAKSLPEVAAALQSGEVTSEALVTDYLKRIEEIDRAGPSLQSILALNPDALDDARALDAKRAAGDVLGPLHGVPVLLKDNIETKDNIATTAGALALKDNITGRDSPLAAGL